PSATLPLGPSASPALQAGPTPGSSGTASPPANGCSCQRPISLPLSSSNQTTAPPSGVTVPATTPVGWSVTCRCVPATRSQACTCHDPDWLEAYTSRSGWSTPQRG